MTLSGDGGGSPLTHWLRLNQVSVPVQAVVEERSEVESRNPFYAAIGDLRGPVENGQKLFSGIELSFSSLAQQAPSPAQP